MADVELILKVDNVSAITSIKETELALAELKQTSEGGSDEQISLLKKQISILDSFKKKTKEAETGQEEYNEVIDETTDSSNKAGNAVGGMGKKLGGIAATVTIVVAALRSLATAFKETTAGMNATIKVGSVFRQLMYDIVTLNFKNGDSMQKGLDIARKQLALQRQQIADIKSLANYQVLYNKYMAEANNNSRNAVDRQKSLSSATELYNSIMDKKVANAKEEWLISNDDLANKPKSHKLQQKTNELYAAFILLQQEQILNNEKLQEQALGIRTEEYERNKKKYLDEIQAANDAYDKRLEDQKRFQNMALKLADEYDKARLDSLEGIAKLEGERDFALLSLMLFRDEMLKSGKLDADMIRQINFLSAKVGEAFEKGLTDYIQGSTKSLTDELVDIFGTTIDTALSEVSGKLQSFGGTPAKGETSIWEMIGLSPESEKGQDTINAIKDSANNLVNEIARSLDVLYAKRVDDADRNRALIEDQLSFAEDELEREIELARIGYANNVDLKKQEVAAINAEREKAIRAQRKAVAEQQKMEALSQAISLTTSAAMIISEAIKEYGLYGLIIAALEIAGLWVAWDSYKDQAKASTKLAAGGSGDSTGMVTGRSHAEGGEHFLDHVEVEGGEKWGVLSKRASGKYGEMFDYMVDSFNKDQVPDIFPQVASVVTVDNNGSNSRLDKVITEQKKMNDRWGKDQRIMISGGRKIITKGNKVRIIG